MKSKWNYETTVKFIQQYKKHECLWNFSSYDYKSKQKRDAAAMAIAKEMCIEDFGVTEVKNKIKNLRSTYCQEIKKIADSKSSGAGLNNVYVSNLKWLNEIEEVFANDLKKSTHENITTPSAVPEMKVAQSSTTASQENKSKATTTTSSAICIASSSRPKKRSREIVQTTNMSSTTLPDKVNKAENETLFDIFGKSVVMQLKNLSMENALLAQQNIQCILTEIGIKDYREKNEKATSMYNYNYKSVASPTSEQSNYAESCDEYQLIDENPSKKQKFCTKN